MGPDPSSEAAGAYFGFAPHLAFETRCYFKKFVAGCAGTALNWKLSC